jgi:beta-galactosidase/beta-glucuronidase
MMKLLPSSLVVLACSLGIAIAQGSQPVPYKVQTPPLDTDWTYKVGTNPWPEYPRPQLQRDAWQSLNGIWTFQPTGPGADDSGSPPEGPLQSEVLVPSCIESGLSGLQTLNITDMWFATSFKIPQNWNGQNIILNFEAVDYQATVFVNGARAGNHTGGYFRFGIDITKLVNFDGDNSL